MIDRKSQIPNPNALLHSNSFRAVAPSVLGPVGLLRRNGIGLMYVICVLFVAVSSMSQFYRVEHTRGRVYQGFLCVCLQIGPRPSVVRRIMCVCVCVCVLPRVCLCVCEYVSVYAAS